MPDQTLKWTNRIGNWAAAIILGNTREIIARIDERTTLMLEDLKEIKPKVSEMFPKVDVLWTDKYAPARSPRKLNEIGNHILNNSGIREIIEEKKTALLEKVRALKPSNAYDAEQIILSVVKDLAIHCPDVVARLKDGAFKVGQNIDVLLLVGGIYLRDLIFRDLGFLPEDLDKQE